MVTDITSLAMLERADRGRGDGFSETLRIQLRIMNYKVAHLEYAEHPEYPGHVEYPEHLECAEHLEYSELPKYPKHPTAYMSWLWS